MSDAALKNDINTESSRGPSDPSFGFIPAAPRAL
jgi:hypothetical protein